MAIEILENSRCTFFCIYALVVYCYQRSKIYRVESSLKTPDKYFLSNVPFKPRPLKEKLSKLGDRMTRNTTIEASSRRKKAVFVHDIRDSQRRCL